MKCITSYRFRLIFTLALAASMALVYPAHLIIDHSGLFHNHNHNHSYDHESHQHPDELPHSEGELCALCMSLSSMEASEFIHFAFTIIDESYHKTQIRNGNNKLLRISDARAPPTDL